MQRRARAAAPDQRAPRLTRPRAARTAPPRSFAHALWVSSRTASTLGFTNIYPNPDCIGPNLTVMLQAR